MACPVDEDRSPLAEDFFLVFRTLNMMYQLQSTPDKGVTPRGWFESEVLGRPEDGTRDSGRVPISQDLWGGWKGGSRRRVARGGAFAHHPLAHRPSVGRLERAGVEEPTEPCAESSRNHPGVI